MKKIRQFLKKQQQRLTVQIMAYVLIAIIPVNLLALYVIMMLRNDSAEVIRQSYLDEWNLYIETTNSELTTIQNEIIAYREELLEEINPEKNSAARQIAELNLFEDLRNNMDACEFLDVVYLFNAERNIHYLGYDSTEYELDFENKAKEALKHSGNYQSGTDFIIIDDMVFLQRKIVVYGYEYGFLINCSDLLGRLAGFYSGTDCSMYLIDQKAGKAYQYGSDDTIDADQVDRTRLNENRFCYTENLVSGNISLTVSIPDKSIYGIYPKGFLLLVFFDLFSLCLIPLLIRFIYRNVLRPIRTAVDGMRQIEEDRLDYHIEDTAKSEEFQYLYNGYNHMVDNLNSLTIEAYEAELEKTRLDALNARLQVNPHMLLNSFNMIHSLALSKDSEMISQYSRLLIRYFRYVLRKDQSLVEMRDEVGFIVDYIEIQRIRFPGQFTFVFDMDEELETIPLPPFIIENFVENCIKYALIPGEMVEIMLLIRREEDILKISIVDTGNGMDEERVSLLNSGEMVKDSLGTHIGVWNSRKRIMLYYGSNAKLHFTSSVGEGTQVWIELPLNELRKDEGKQC